MYPLQQPVPKHIQVRDVLAGRIARGEYPPGGKLPPVRQIADDLSVSVTVAGEAVQMLAAEGLVRVLGRRRGTVVAGPAEEAEVLPPRLVFGPQDRLGWTDPVPAEVAEVIAAETGMVDARGPYGYVAEFLRLEQVPRHEVVTAYRRTQLIRDRAGQPDRLEVSWFHPRWAALVKDEETEFRPLASPELPVPSLGGVAWLISQHTGRPVVATSHWFEARPARNDGRETDYMGLAAGAMLLAATYTLDAPDPETGEPVTIEYGEYITRPNRVVQLRYAVALAS